MKEKRPYQVVYLTNIPAPYTVDFFNELGKTINLTVVFESTNSFERNSSWYSENFNDFKAEFLSTKKRSNDNIISLKFLKYLKNKEAVYVIGNYSSFVGMISILYLKLTRKKFAIHSDGSLFKEETKLKTAIKRFFIKKADLCFSSNKITDRFFLHYGQKKDSIVRYPFTSIREKDILHLPLNENYKKNVRQDFFIEKIIGLYVGRVLWGKGIDLLVEIASKIPSNVGIYIIGGEPEAEIENVIKNKNITNIHFLGFMDVNVILEKYMPLADFFIFPTRSDVWGLVVNEALCKGLPVITTDQCGAGLELIEDGVNGYVVPSENVERMLDSIQKLLPCINDKMSQNCLDSIKKYTIENMSVEYIKGLDMLFNKGKR